MVFSLIQDGTTSVSLDTSLLRTTTELSFDSLDNTVEPAAEGLWFGFDITEESDFQFSTEDGFVPIEGEIEHTVTVTFDTPVGAVTVGDFTIGFDAERQTDNLSGFFVQNTVDGAVPNGAIIFDVSNRGDLAAEGTELNLSNTDLLVAPEFAQLLLDTQLATDNLTGTDVGDAVINAITENVTSTDVTTGDGTTGDVTGGDVTGGDVTGEDVTGEDVTEIGELLVQDGLTSLELDTDLLATSAGLTFSNAENAIKPASRDFSVGFPIIEESDFQFDIEQGFEPVNGEIEHTGSITFNSSVVDITVKNLSIGYDAERQADGISGFFVQNNLDGVLPDDAILFDVGNPSNFSIEEMEINLGTSELFVSSELAATLLDAGLTTNDLTGVDVGDVAINAITESDF